MENENNKLVLENSMESNILKLRKLVNKKYKIDVPIQCDKFLERCIRQKDGNLEKAAKLVQAIYQVIADFKNWKATLDPSCYGETCYNIPVICPLATRDNLGRRVIVAQSKRWNPDNISFEELAFAVWMMSQMAAIDEEQQIHGYVVLADIQDFSFRQACSINHRKLLKAAKWLQSGVMGKIKGIHFINHPRVFGLLYEGVKPFLSEKMKKRINFHKNMSEFHESIDIKPTLLPKYLGGDLEAEEYMDIEFMKNLLNSAEVFQDTVNYQFPVK